MKSVNAKGLRAVIRLMLCLAMACVCAMLGRAQDSPSSFSVISVNPNAVQVSIPAALHGAIRLEGPWSFQVGDDPRWADPNFDDSKWERITLSSTLLDQGIEPYSGYAWYRIRVQLQPSSKAAETRLALLVAPYSVGQLQVFANGAEIGRTRGMREPPSHYQAGPFPNQLPLPLPDGTIVLAIRSWAGLPIQHGLVDRIAIGGIDHVQESYLLARARHWDEHILAGLLVSFLFFCVAILGAVLYAAQRHHVEYLWMALLCLSVTLSGVIEYFYNTGMMPLTVFTPLDLYAGRLFMVATLEFVLCFAGSIHARIVRGIQIAILLVPLFSMMSMEKIYEVLSVSSQIVFSAVVVVMLFRAWRRGLTEAGVMLFPFLLGSIGDSTDTLLDFAVYRLGLSGRFTAHWLHLGPLDVSTSELAFLIFLGSLVAVIFYRFIRVSLVEQRSEAEIEAARSVQALLIPTTLPSNRTFMLESAYLPMNGVGGDFFQALPLKDDSMLIVVGDVSGKGLQAAMNASTLVGALRNELSHEPGTVLAHLNQVMLGATSGPGGFVAAGFATCLCARIWPSGKMVISNAGHLSPYRDGREIELPACLPLGVIPGVEYEETTLQLQHGERLTFLSDGVVEATDTKGELFGFERTKQVSHEPARYIAQIAQRFGQTDDITVVSLYFVPA
ncbi:MAG TPA: PP2C family protein-serine/threonine phosphatase [Acidobacteriaceae bacterium]|nr:PP2C family protein-serine/threonine phosphatase [Acidobacteriaceae bacterium]